MISVTETSHLPAPPERAWALFLEMDRLYPAWHPGHRAWRPLRGRALAPGAVAFVDEWVGRRHIAARFVIDRAEPNRFLGYRIGLPFALVRGGGWFRFTPAADGGTIVEAEVHFGYAVPVLGSLLDRVLLRVLPLEELRRHMREEGEALPALLPALQRVAGSGSPDDPRTQG